jgi:NAD(P)-dependent dehydrogenase (short-subunit alcohol dehydrogenase family)
MIVASFGRYVARTGHDHELDPARGGGVMEPEVPGVRGVPEALRRFDLTGRVAVVTGASSGLGEGLARALASAGARVAVVARRQDRLAKLADEIGGAAIGCDLLDLAQIAQIVPQVAAELGGPEILVNAAGNIFSYEPAEREPLEAIRQTLDLNLIAPFLLCQEVFPHMVAAGRGSIVQVSSISGRVGIPGIPQASYAASKLGLSGLTAELAVQWARHSIRVNTVAPGFFRSEITGGMYTDERTRAWLRRNTPLPADGTADDFAGAVLWLVSDAGRYVTGQTIVVDGGWTAR